MTRILVVDDDDGVRDVIHAVLDLEGYEVVVASNAHAALRALDEQRPDLVISDMVMPHMDGVALYEAARQRQPDLPVMLLSAACRGAIPQGATFVAKPFDVAHLLAVVDRLLSARANPLDG